MAFVDTLLAHHPDAATLRVAHVDTHAAPGGHWNDAYGFVQLHQGSDMYGVETEELAGADGADGGKHRATKAEMLAYYARVAEKLAGRGQYTYHGGVAFVGQDGGTATLRTTGGEERAVAVRGKVVDARFLSPDIPSQVPPRFQFDGAKVTVLPVNALPELPEVAGRKFVVIGGGKTGMDCVVWLLKTKQVPVDAVQWVVPNPMWITAREHVGNCMELLHEGVKAAPADGALPAETFLLDAFKAFEEAGKAYRFDPAEAPRKFKDTTLSIPEKAVLESLTHVVRGARVAAVQDDGTLALTDGRAAPLPSGWAVGDTVFVHCSAGCFNYTTHDGEAHKPVFDERHIRIQDVYGTPGFCIVGAALARIEALGGLSLAEKNALALNPTSAATVAASPDPLGPSGGDLTPFEVGPGNQLVQRVANLRNWYAHPALRAWLHPDNGRLRIYNLRDYKPEAATAMLDAIWARFQKTGAALPPSAPL
eukprot:TRINITY_DN32635_c0_g1_i1.p1 TRINITY_DN32635_c0_g1~~TRINITY_DN32635_c0_g1_i1.p1  ORF type:complete len:521 (+),score=195.60 TRINITY_DN32635_c0_g1_i1:128-1564(+)